MRARGAVTRAAPLRDDALAAERASVLEHDVAGVLERGVEHDPRPGLPDEARQRALAFLKRRAAEVATVKFEKIKGTQRHLAVAAAPELEFERGEPVFLKGNRFAVDQARARLERAYGLNYQREA